MKLERGSAFIRGFIGLAVAAQAAPAWGYARMRTDSGMVVRWWDSCIKITPSRRYGPVDIPQAEAEPVTREALSAWSRESLTCTYIRLSLEPAAYAGDHVKYDQVNSLIYQKERWCRHPPSGAPCDPEVDGYPTSALALTTLFFRDRPGQPEDGRLLDTDVEVNAVHFRWAVLTDMNDPRGMDFQDLGNALTHEFGHVIGLDHNCWSGGNRRPIDHDGQEVPDCVNASIELQEATMFVSANRGDISKRTLAPDDIRGVCDIYPLAADPNRCGEKEDTGCAVAGATSDRLGPSALLLVAVALAGAAVTRRRGSRNR